MMILILPRASCLSQTIFHAIILLPVLLAGCGKASDRERPPAKWTTGFWFWGGGTASVAASVPALDVIFCQVGTIRKESRLGDRELWSVYGYLPEQLPTAREYWLVFRFDRQAVPGLAAAHRLAEVASELLGKGRRRGLNVAGIQLDIDSPTRALPEYAAFLGEVRKGLPGAKISITGLLDWFRAGTAISDVLKEVDEFVPQLYDVQDADSYGGGLPIAMRVDAAKWGPVFNQYRKPFRIGISTFGRARLLRVGKRQMETLQDLKPLDIAVDPAFQLQTSRTQANELVLTYAVTRETRIGYNDFEAGDQVQFVLATAEAIQAAVDGAKRMGGSCGGVMFFRWPAFNEALAALPDEVLTAAGVITPTLKQTGELRAVDGSCGTMSCVDLYLVNPSPLSPDAIRYRIQSSAELEYFVPRERVPVRLSGPRQLELSLPPYCGRSRMYLGRAVTAKRAEFTIEREP